jgi:DNA replication factor CDT1 like
MKQTILPEHFPHIKLDIEPCLKRKVKDSELCVKTLKTEDIPSGKTKISIPPSKVNELSPETLSILNTLNLCNQDKPLRNSEDVLNSVSAREKYQDLLDTSRKLALPYKYKRLLKLQEYIDTIINNARIRKIPTAFENIKLAIENTYNTVFEIENLQRILYLCPDLYHLHWEIESGDQKLYIDFPENSQYCLSGIHNRNSILNKELLDLAKKYHSMHLSSLPESLNFNPDVSKTWHSSFNLHEVPDIQLSPLPESTQESPTVAKVSVAKQIRGTRLIMLCKIILRIFSSHKTPSIFLRSLIKKIEIEKGKKEDIKLIENDVVELCEIFYMWISIIPTGSGDVVRINKQSDFTLKFASLKIKQKYN